MSFIAEVFVMKLMSIFNKSFVSKTELISDKAPVVDREWWPSNPCKVPPSTDVRIRSMGGP